MFGEVISIKGFLKQGFNHEQFMKTLASFQRENVMILSSSEERAQCLSTRSQYQHKQDKQDI